MASFQLGFIPLAFDRQVDRVPALTFDGGIGLAGAVIVRLPLDLNQDVFIMNGCALQPPGGRGSLHAPQIPGVVAVGGEVSLLEEVSKAQFTLRTCFRCGFR